MEGHNCIMYMHLIPASEKLLCTIAANLDLGLEKKNYETLMAPCIIEKEKLKNKDQQ